MHDISGARQSLELDLSALANTWAFEHRAGQVGLNLPNRPTHIQTTLSVLESDRQARLDCNGCEAAHSSPGSGSDAGRGRSSLCAFRLPTAAPPGSVKPYALAHSQLRPQLLPKGSHAVASAKPSTVTSTLLCFMDLISPRGLSRDSVESCLNVLRRYQVPFNGSLWPRKFDLVQLKANASCCLPR